MATRAFSVFIDEKPSSSPKLPKALVLSPTSHDLIHSSSEAGPSSSVSSSEKENLHPLTGSRIGPVNASGSKRKSSVLVTKLHNPPEAKKAKKDDSSEAPAKKRKLAFSGTKSSREPKSKNRKTKPLTRSKTVPDLPRVNEEEDKDERIARSLSQSEIDSRCYDLTVSPLANVSDAYRQAPSPSIKCVTAKHDRKVESTEPELQDDLGTPASAASSPTPRAAKTPVRDRSLPPPVLSTPERKRIYASFTFSSPIRPYSARRNPSSSSVRISDAEFAF